MGGGPLSAARRALAALGGALGGALAVVVTGVAIVGATPAAAARPAKKADDAWVVLVHTEGSVPSSWTPALQQAAMKAPGGRVWVSPPAVTVEELQVALGCTSWDAACAAQTAAAADAGNALLVSLGTRPTGEVTLLVAGIDGNGAPRDEPRRLVLEGHGAADLRVARAFVANAVAGTALTALVVTSDLEGDEVVLDGVVVGHTPATLLDVAPGAHELQLRRAGFAPLLRTIDVKAGEVNRERAVMGANGPTRGMSPTVGTGAPAGDAASPALAGWTLVGLGAVGVVAGGIVGAVFGLPVVEYTNNLDGGVLATTYTTLDGTVVDASERTAYLAAKFGVQPRDVLDEAVFGERLANAQNLALTGVAIAVAGAAIVATGVGLALSADDEPPAAPPTAPARTKN